MPIRSGGLADRDRRWEYHHQGVGRVRLLLSFRSLLFFSFLPSSLLVSPLYFVCFLSFRSIFSSQLYILSLLYPPFFFVFPNTILRPVSHSHYFSLSFSPSARWGRRETFYGFYSLVMPQPRIAFIFTSQSGGGGGGAALFFLFLPPDPFPRASLRLLFLTVSSSSS